MTERGYKRVGIFSDLHSGHLVGLTHPDFDARPNDSESPAYRFWRTRRKCWRWFMSKVEELKPFDLVIINGDCIDGKGERSGSTELLTADRNEQAEMAVAAIEMLEAQKILMSYGTSYHTGRGEDFEDTIAKEVNALKIGGHDFVDVNGAVFDYRHHVGSSSIPHGRHTAVARERLWNWLWSEHGEYPKADILLRSHVHYHAHCGGPDWLAMTTPALQAYGSKFGARRASGRVDYGFVHFDVTGKTEWTWQSHILRFKRPRSDILRI